MNFFHTLGCMLGGTQFTSGICFISLFRLLMTGINFFMEVILNIFTQSLRRYKSNNHDGVIRISVRLYSFLVYNSFDIIR